MAQVETQINDEEEKKKKKKTLCRRKNVLQAMTMLKNANKPVNFDH